MALLAPIVSRMLWHSFRLSELRGELRRMVAIAIGMLLVAVAWVAFSAYRTLMTKPTIYHKEWTITFIRAFHEKTGGWPTGWQSLEQTVDVRSPFPFSDITRSVSVRWQNLGKEIDLHSDWYLRTEPDLDWQGQDLNRELFDYIHTATHPDGSTSPR